MTDDEWRIERWKWRRVRAMERCILDQEWNPSVAKTVRDFGSVRPDCGVDGEYVDRLGPLLEAAMDAEEVIGVDELERFADAQRECTEGVLLPKVRKQ